MKITATFIDRDLRCQRAWKLAFAVSCLLTTVDTTAAAASTPELSIDEVVLEVLARNPEIKFYEAEIAAARADRRNAGRLANPELSSTIGRKVVSGGGLRDEGLAWSVTVMQPFEWPGRIGLRKAIANHDVELAGLGLARFKAALTAHARATAHDLAVAQQRAAAGRAVADRLRELRETLVARDPAGLTPLLETRVIEASEVKTEHTAAEAEHDVEHLLIELNYLRGQPPTTPLRIAEEPLQFKPAPDLERLQAAAATNNFDLRLRAAELEQQGFKVELARNERFPGISAGPFYSEEEANEREQVVGVAIAVPLPLWQNNGAKIEAAEARRAQAGAVFEFTRRRLERDVADYAHKYEHALGVLAKWRPDAVEHFREAAELADRHYRLGAVPVNTYLELQRQYVEAVEALLEARREALAARHQLELLTGWDLSEDGPQPPNPNP